MNKLSEDQQIFSLIEQEKSRQKDGLVLIPSENYVSPAVLEALGSVLTNKYSEGFPGRRYYSGNKFIDEIEKIAQRRACELFRVPHANVQPYSGSPANQAVYFALCRPGETVMGMSLSSGGHLTHGHKVNFSGTIYNGVHYTVNGETGFLDYEQIRKLALKVKPKLIWSGGTAYPRFFDWERMGKIALEVGAYHVADISHYAGLIAAGIYPSPVDFADVITTTTHKTLRGPRGAILMVTGKGMQKDPDLVEKIDKAVFPGLQAGPHDHQTAAIAVSLKEAATSEFKNYAQQVLINCQTLADELKKLGFDLVTGGTDNHLILIDLNNLNLSGKEVSLRLEEVNIFVNKNTIPGETRSPFETSGIRLGTPAVTTRGMKEKEMGQIANWIGQALKDGDVELGKIKEEVKDLCGKFPI